MHTNRQKKKPRSSNVVCYIAIVILGIMLFVTSDAFPAQPGQRTFSSPDEAVKTLSDAVKADNVKELAAIFGPAGKDILSSGDSVGDRAARKRFLDAFEEKHAVIRKGDSMAVLHIGGEDWPFPVPVVERKGKWFFDAKAGKEEILNRFIGRNELNTIKVCLAYVDAQREYALTDHENDGFHEYAQKFVSAPGKKDGLYWEAKEGEEESPLGDFLARAAEEGYIRGEKPIPYHGYYFKILMAQGRNAPDGAFDYLVNRKMIGGFALVAYPARYGVSGVMTFIVNHEGVVYQKDLGKGTRKIAEAMKRFDPDRSWKRSGDMNTQ